MATAGSIVIDLLLKTGSFETDTKRAEKAMKSMKSSAESVSKGIVAGFTSIVGVVGGVVAGIVSVQTAIDGLTNAINQADRLDELSARYGIATETLSGWGYAAKMTGSDLEGLAGAMPKFSKNVAEASDASSAAGAAFAALGISVKDQYGHLRSFQDLLPEVMDRFSGMTNETLKTWTAMQLFGKSGAEFLEFLSLGSSGLQTMEERAKALGIIIDTQTTSAAAAFNDRLDDLRAATQGWFTQLAAQLLPSLTSLTIKLTDIIKDGGGVRDIAESITNSFKAIGDAAGLFSGAITALDRLRGMLVAVELQGNAAMQALNPANWNTADMSRLSKQYKLGASYGENGYAAMQSSASASGSYSTGSRTRGRASAADIEQTRKAYEEKQRASEVEKRLQALLDGTGEKAKASSKKLKDSSKDATDQILDDYDAIYGAGQDRADAEVANLERELALHGQIGEAAKVAYDIQAGAYGALSQQQADYLESLALTKDAVDDYDAIYGDMDTKAKDSTDTMSVYAEQAARNMQDSFADFLFDPFKDGLGGLVKSFAQTLEKMAAQAAAAKVFQLLTGWATGYSGSGSGWINAIGGFLGGKRAAGGPVWGGSMFEVGENNRPEVLSAADGRTYLIPGNNGRVSPVTSGVSSGDLSTGSGAGGDTFHMSFNVNGSITDRERQMMAQTQRNAVLQAKRELAQEVYTGRGTISKGLKEGWTNKRQVG